MHGQGQRPGALRGVDPGAGTRPRRDRPGAVVGHDPGAVHPLRLRPRHPDHGDQGEAVLDRRQPLGAGDRVRRDGGPLGCAAARRLAPDPTDGHRADRRGRRLPGGRAFRARRCRAGRGRHRWAAERAGRLVWLGPHRHRREPPRRHQEPGDLRVPGQPGADDGPRRPGVDLPGARPPAGEEPAGAPVRGAGLRRPVVQPAQAGAGRLRRREPAVRDRRGAAAAGAGLVHGDGAPQPAQPVRLRPGHLRRGRPVPPRGQRGLRAPVGPGDRDLVGDPGPGRRRSDEGGAEHALARPLRRRPGGRAAGLHGQPRRTTAASRATTWRAAGRTSGAWPGRGSSATRRPGWSSPRSTGSRTSSAAGSSRSSPPTRTSTRPSSAGSRRWPGRPAPSCTRAAAATTRSPPTCACGPAAS